MDERVKAIRQDKQVGNNTCSMIDECQTDNELIEAMDEQGITLANAVKWARRWEKLWMEQEGNQRYE